MQRPGDKATPPLLAMLHRMLSVSGARGKAFPVVARAAVAVCGGTALAKLAVCVGKDPFHEVRKKQLEEIVQEKVRLQQIIDQHEAQRLERERERAREQCEHELDQDDDDAETVPLDDPAWPVGAPAFHNLLNDCTILEGPRQMDGKVKITWTRKVKGRRGGLAAHTETVNRWVLPSELRLLHHL